jgi:carbon-monoxide dehydrogenase small subunit
MVGRAHRAGAGAREASVKPSKRVRLTVSVNGKRYARELPASTTLADLLRDHLLLTGTKIGCDVGECGACTVLVDGSPLLACLTLAAEVDGREVTTIESDDARMRALADAFVEEGGLQCGFCTPGMIVAASRIAPGADDSTIRSALAGNLCRCTGYTKIVTAVRSAHSKTKRAKR